MVVIALFLQQILILRETWQQFVGKVERFIFPLKIYLSVPG
jgi:hypothetical protein